MRRGSRKATTRRSPRRPTTTARWRCRCSSTGCRAARTDFAKTDRPSRTEKKGRALRRLKVEIDPDRHVIRRLFPGAHIAVAPGVAEPVAGLWRQQQMIDAQALIFLP